MGPVNTTPLQILRRSITDYGSLLDHGFVTVVETVLGFLIAAVTGVLTALAIFYSRLFERAVYHRHRALQGTDRIRVGLFDIKVNGGGL